jgi:ABC-type multidrug transport system fused ATPase/permease subunit
MDESAELGRLGEGGSQDRLRFRLVLRILFRCVPFLKPVGWHLVAVVGIGFLLTILAAYPAIQIVNVWWNHVLQGDPLSEFLARMFLLDVPSVTRADLYGPEQREIVLRHVVVASVGLIFLLGPPGFGLFYYRIWILQRVNHLLRLRLVDRFQALSLRFHSDSRVGDAIYRMYQDSAMVTQLIDVLVVTPLENFGRFLFSLGLVALWDPWLALVLMLSWPLVMLLGLVFSRPLRVDFRRARETNSALTSRIQETLSGIKLIKAYGAEASEQKRFEAESLRAFGAAYAARDRYAVFRLLLFYLVGAAMIGGVGWATYLTAENAELFGKRVLAALGFTAVNLGMWDLGFYNNFKDRFGDGSVAIQRLMQLWGRVQDITIGLDRVFEILDLEPEVQDAADAIPLESIEHGIRYRDVSFRYQRDRPVLRDVDLEVKPGSITAIVGPTGSGKSTLMALLLRLFDPEQGGIEIDGTDLRRFTLASLRKGISIALQENVLFGTTVRENIRFAVPDAGDQQVREAARIACADPFIEKLPAGYDTLLGERGTKLSTGQRQRLSIARALLKDTPILILDEPTASLDAATEHAVLQNLAEWGAGRVIFLITHRLSTIRRADQVIFLSDGAVVEGGTHDELMEREGGAYRSLVLAEERSLASAGSGS